MGRQEEESGIGVCPFDPNHNSTALYTDGKIFSGTVADADSRNPLILRKSDKLIRTQLRDSMFLNEPNFVSSYDKDDKVLFFFRETAVENINCGKAVFSRVGRVCKEDEGDAIRPRQNTFTSFFKARLNCSIPGEFPFYFDEIQATSLFGQGNYKPTKDSGDRSDMIYGVFNTPDNSIQGSAVCAFRYSDIADVFRGRFKGQDSIRHNWLPVRWDLTPTPHPEQCETRSQDLSYDSLMFIKTHPLMDEAVPALGHMPMLVHTSFKSKFTAIAIDWQVRAADGHYYDVIFVGTDDGRIIKSINKGKGAQIESVVIEDIQVLDEDEPVVNLKVLSNRADDTRQKLVVISKRRIVSVPLHRCAKALSCSKCVALQDPYCAYNKDMKECISAELGIQNIADGKHESCGPDDVVVKEEPAVTSSPVQTPTCACPATKDQEPPKDKLQGKDESGVKENPPTKVTNDGDKTDPEGNTGASSQSPKTGGTQVEILVIAVVVSIILSLVSGFIIGFKFQSCRNSRDRDSVFYDSKCSTLQRGRNRLSSGDNPYFHTDHTSLTPKQMNYVVNVKNSKTNSGTETKPVTKSNKVYL
ncbi:semaphorin-1A [Aplysia californica]|uniref:Semaphorin-1A n=1 Tax=Aplysia californica TaxID=6500 RepID=A0ABM1A881_APLCA|nr:semaphorin-1A [Aplysia californica]